MNCDILQQDIQSLLEYFAKNMYRAKDSSEHGNEIVHRCTVLMKLDYSVIEISNLTGELSTHYPSQLLIPEYEIKNLSTSQHTNNGLFSGPSQINKQQTIYENTYDSSKLRDLINKARFARCRARFPLPVILYRGKFICRSATLSGGPEIYGRSGLDYFFYGGLESMVTSPTNIEDEAYEAQETSLSDEGYRDANADRNSEWQLFDRVRSQDIKLLKTLNIGTIVDFMVEKKKVKFGMNVTSSEKVDKEKRYADFKIISLPYPGCEFFRDFRDNNYSGDDLKFDWTQSHVDANIGVPDDNISSQLNVEWDNYKNWDLVQITQNYLKLLLKYLQDNSSGLLIHCISGWDRTPLFVSLMRLSLWADGAIHQTLNAAQILYFTIAYDWLLFGHNLPDRLSKGEEIFFFCFYALKYIMDDEYSILGQRYKSKHSSGSSSIGVIRTDSECMLDGILFDESRGSNVSLNSTCSCVSTHQEQNSVNNHVHQEESAIANGNGWLAHSHDSSIGSISNDSSNFNNSHAWSPQPLLRTSPMSVPSAKLRQRQESSSSISVGSWQMISGTGSLRSSESSISNETQHFPFNNCINAATTPNANQRISTESSCCTIVDDDCFLSSFTQNDQEGAYRRRERLNSVRSLFYNCYCSTIAFKFKNGPDSTIGSLLGNFAEKVGLAHRTSV